MTDIINKDMESKLDKFLKENEPMAPAPKADEEQRILAAITAEHLKEQHERQRARFASKKWFVPVAAAAVLVISLWLNPFKDKPAVNTAEIEEFIEETMLAEYDTESDEEFVGGGYLMLAEMISRRR